MKPVPVIAIFDIGKTNKKLFFFDEQYHVVYEEKKQLDEITDEDGFPCENVYELTQWVQSAFSTLLKDERFEIRAVNFSAYGASFVYLDKNGKVVLPLYNYLKPYSPELTKKFYEAYGGESLMTMQTASPVLGSLNSGMQLYRLKYEKPEAFAAIKYALHLPQYLSYILSSTINSDITSIGCHTNLWDFQKNNYHQWVKQEGILEKLPPVLNCKEIAGLAYDTVPVGVGLHDSSAALIPYLYSFAEPFILLSTGTWCISLNPFNHTGLSDYELQHDCLCYLSYEGKPVKASRLFAGYEHEQQVKKLSEHFKKETDYYKRVKADLSLIKKINSGNSFSENPQERAMTGQSSFSDRKLDQFANYDEAYHQLITDLVIQQVQSTNLVLKGTDVKQIFVDGGFSSNTIYMTLLANAYPEIKIYTASVSQASALGAALAIHKKWNHQPTLPKGIKLQLFERKE